MGPKTRLYAICMRLKGVTAPRLSFSRTPIAHRDAPRTSAIAYCGLPLDSHCTAIDWTLNRTRQIFSQCFQPIFIIRYGYIHYSRHIRVSRVPWQCCPLITENIDPLRKTSAKRNACDKNSLRPVAVKVCPHVYHPRWWCFVDAKCGLKWDPSGRNERPAPIERHRILGSACSSALRHGTKKASAFDAVPP